MKIGEYCAQCGGSIVGRGRSVGAEVAAVSGLGALRGDLLCGTCYWKFRKVLDNGKNICPVCQEPIGRTKAYRIRAEILPYIPRSCIEGEFFCRRCYVQARQNSRNGVKQPHFEAEEHSNQHEDTNFAQFRTEQEGSSSSEMGGKNLIASEKTSDTESIALDTKLQCLVQNPYIGSPIADVSRYRIHVNSVAGGLFDLFLNLVDPAHKDREVRIACLVGQLGHLADRRYSSLQWELSDFLYLGGISDRNRRSLCRAGIGMHPSKQMEHIEQRIQEHQHMVESVLQNPGMEVMFVADDFHAIWAAKTPKKNGRFSSAAHVANVILKDITQCGFCLDAARYPSSLVPRAFSVDVALEYIAKHWTACKSALYETTRLPQLRIIASTLQPYGSVQGQATWKNPISMDQVLLHKCHNNPFRSARDIATVVTQSVADFGGYLTRRHMFATGDWHTYHAVLSLVVRNPSKFGHIIPLPGPFHIGLNAQEGVFLWYRPVVTALWRSVFPQKALSITPTPIQRKYLLDLICKGWKICRESCIAALAACRNVPIEAVILLQFLEEHVPLSLDIYAVYLSGEYEAYEHILLHALHMFAQLGKVHYVLCILLFVIQADHWRVHFPNLFDTFRKNYHKLSEEEVEIFHSTLRPHLHGEKSPEQLTRMVNFCGASKDLLRSWRGENCIGTKIVEKEEAEMEGAEERMSAAISDLFNKAMTVSTACSMAPKHQWQSSIWGAFDDHLLPLPLQRNPVARTNSLDTLHMHTIPCTGILDTTLCRLCGHVKNEAPDCRECRNMLMQIAHNTLSCMTL